MNKLKQLLSILPEPLRDYYLDLKYSKQLKKWQSEGCPLPTPHIVKQMAIKSFQDKYKVETLIETGTYLGDMVYAQRKLFGKIYTIELSEQLYKKATARLRKYTNIEVVQGDSGLMLSSIVKQLGKRSIFWLDGHYSGGITAKGSRECPVAQELNEILKSKYEHIILIDDAREFNGTNDYPTMEEIGTMIRRNGFPNTVINTKNDIIEIELLL